MNWDAWRYYLRGRLHTWRGRHAQAATEYRTALQYAPQWQRAIHNLAYALAAQQHWADAQILLQQIVQTSPEDATAWFNLGYCRQQLGQFAAATQALQQAVQRQPKLDQAWYGLGLCYAQLGQYPDAVLALERAASLKCMNGQILYQLGIAQHRLAESDKVREIAKQLNRFDRHNAKRLIVDTGRDDLLPLVRDLRSL